MEENRHLMALSPLRQGLSCPLMVPMRTASSHLLMPPWEAQVRHEPTANFLHCSPVLRARAWHLLAVPLATLGSMVGSLHYISSRARPKAGSQ